MGFSLCYWLSCGQNSSLRSASRSKESVYIIASCESRFQTAAFSSLLLLVHTNIHMYIPYSTSNVIRLSPWSNGEGNSPRRSHVEPTCLILGSGIFRIWAKTTSNFCCRSKGAFQLISTYAKRFCLRSNISLIQQVISSHSSNFQLNTSNRTAGWRN